MSVLTRHQMGAILLAALRQEGLGTRDLFEGRQEPLSWFFRGLAFDQSELDIMESGAIEMLHAPSALVELVIDEFALACANLGMEGVSGYLTAPAEPAEAAQEATEPIPVPPEGEHLREPSRVEVLARLISILGPPE